MLQFRTIGAALAALGLATGGYAQTATSRPATPAKAPASRAELERQFQEMMTNAVLRGTWQVTSGPGADAPLSPPKTETYTIVGVAKEEGDYWIVSARMQFAEVDVTVPIRVRVVWAEDTPVITLDDLAIPQVGTYSARVMLFRGFYAGTWFGQGYGGILSGKIERASATSSPAKSKE